MKRHLIIAVILLGVLVSGAFGYLGNHFSDILRSVDASLSDASYEIRNEPIDPERAVSQVAKSAASIAVFVAGMLVVLLIVVMVHGMRKQAGRLPGARLRRRTKEVATSGPRDRRSARP